MEIRIAALLPAPRISTRSARHIHSWLRSAWIRCAAIFRSSPGQSVDGLVVFSYPLSREEWDKKKSMQLTVSFNGAEDVTLNAPPS